MGVVLMGAGTGLTHIDLGLHHVLIEMVAWTVHAFGAMPILAHAAPLWKILEIEANG